MKSALFKVMLAIHSFFITIISTVVFLASLRIISFETLCDTLILMHNDIKLSAVITLASLLLLIFSLAFLVFSTTTTKKHRGILRQSQIGDIIISLNTIENIALSATRQITGLRDSKAYVKKEYETVLIEIVTSVIPDVNIPAVSEEIQTKVKASIQKTTGLEVGYVKVRINGLHVGYKSRVE